MSKVIVVGGGAAGMMAAVFAAENGHHVQIYEKNDRLGRKLFITGKGRCNITNASDVEELFQAVVSNPKFLYSAFYSFTNEQVIDFFENLGVKTKVERGNRVFPVSDHSSDIIGALQRELHRLGVQISLCTEVEKICVENEKITGIIISDDSQKQKQHFVDADAVIIATGGISYPATGSTGDGYRFAKTCGHKVTELFPALVPMEVKEWYAKQLQGLSLRNVCIRVTDGKRKLYEEFGEMLFTHYGVTGPVILSASSIVGKRLKEKELTLHIDLKPALTEEQLDKRILREFDANHNKQFKNAVDSLFPAKLKPVMTELSGIAEEKKLLATFFLLPAGKGSQFSITYQYAAKDGNNNAITQAIRIENQSLPSTDTWNPGASVSYTIGISRKTISVMSENDITSWEGGTDSETVNGTEEKQITN